MSNYIIDPAVFYWMNVLSHVQTVLAVLGGFTLAGCITLACIYLYQWHMNDEPEMPIDPSSYDKMRYERDLKEYHQAMLTLCTLRKWFIVTLVVGLFLTFVAMFVPSKQTSVEMLVARTATFDNVNWSVAQVKEIIDYIVSALKGSL